MKDVLDQVMVLGSSMVYLAKDSSEEVIKELEKRDLLSSAEGKKMAKDIKDNFQQRKDKLYGSVMDIARKVIDDLGIATKEDLKK